MMLLPELVNNYNCGACNATYYGKTKRYFQDQICEDLGVSHLTVKN